MGSADIVSQTFAQREWHSAVPVRHLLGPRGLPPIPFASRMACQFSQTYPGKSLMLLHLLHLHLRYFRIIASYILLACRLSCFCVFIMYCGRTSTMQDRIHLFRLQLQNKKIVHGAGYGLKALIYSWLGYCLS